MIEYGIRVIDDGDARSNKILRVYFTPMSYFDWIHCSDPVSMHEPAFIRGLFQSYVTRIIPEKPALKDGEEYTVLDLIEESEVVQMQVVNSMVSKAGYDTEESLLGIVRKCRDKSNTLAGAYDTFVMINTDFNFYVQFLNSDIFTRAQIIAALEKIKRFNVEDRYKDSLKEDIEINLASDPESYEDWKFNRQKKKALAEQGRQKPVVAEKREILGEELGDVIEQSKIALDAAMKVSRKAPSKFFDWEKDEQDFE